MKMREGKATAVGARIWFSAVFFGLIGQIAWIVENMYFETFAQDIFANSKRADLSFLVTTLMVILSAITATVTTVVAGGFCDRAGKRKPFIAYGYIIWGFTIMLFATIPMHVSRGEISVVAILLIAFDCIMTVAGSTSNDAAFNAWIADNTDPTNRGRVNSMLSVLPVFAVVIVFIGLGSFYNADNASNSAFFLILGAIPAASGLIALFTLKDSPRLQKTAGKGSLKDFLYGFRPAVMKGNPVLYICLCAACLIGIAQQTFFSYLINFLCITLGLGSGFVVPMAIIIVASAVLTGIVGILSDRFGRKHFYLPLLLIAAGGILSFWLLQFTQGTMHTVIIYAGGTLMMGGILALTGSFSATFQDHIPTGYEGRYQGVRMCFMVLIPMVIGPVISLLLGLNAMGMNGDNFVPPYSIFLAASIVAVLAVIPILYIRKHAEKEEAC
jgi:MFS family permease